LGDTSKKALSN